MRKSIALIIATAMLLALCACGNSITSNEVSYDIPDGKQIPDDAVLDIVTTSHPSWPYNEDWKVWQYIKESIGGTLNVLAVPESDFATKFPLIMAAPDELPDLFGFSNKPSNFGSFCRQGAFLAFEDYEEFLPAYNEFWNSVPEDEKWMKETRRSVDGKIYYSPVHGLERSTNIRGWLYRKDIFDKHNLKAPETIDELYEVSKKLKAIYPDSYPLCMRSAFININVIGSSWKEGFNIGPYYDFNADKWCFGATEKEMYEIVAFFNKMVMEGLVPADFFTMNTASWQELVSTDRGFIMPEYQVRIDFFNSLARGANPEFTMAAMMPPKTEGGVNKVNKYNYPPHGYAVANTGNEADIANAFRYINWLYTDEARELVSWGKEGETYEIVDGKKKFITDGSETVQSLYGINSRGTNICFDPEAIGETVSEEQYAVTDFLLEHTVSELNPTMYLDFTDEQNKKMADLYTSIDTFIDENVQKFIIGQKPLTEWDKFREELLALNIDELLAIYEEVYNAVK